MEVRKRYLLILFFFSILIFFLELGERELWELDETRYG